MNNKTIKRLATATMILLFIGLSAATTLYAQKNDNFQGNWMWKKGADEFELELKQKGNKISGYHIAIGQNGHKVDEADRTQTSSITGSVKGKTATVAFRSGFPDGNGQGTATLILRRRQLYWRIINSGGEHYLPLSAVLKKSI